MNGQNYHIECATDDRGARWYSGRFLGVRFIIREITDARELSGFRIMREYGPIPGWWTAYISPGSGTGLHTQEETYRDDRSPAGRMSIMAEPGSYVLGWDYAHHCDDLDVPGFGDVLADVLAEIQAGDAVRRALHP